MEPLLVTLALIASIGSVLPGSRVSQHQGGRLWSWEGKHLSAYQGGRLFVVQESVPPVVLALLAAGYL